MFGARIVCLLLRNYSLDQRMVIRQPALARRRCLRSQDARALGNDFAERLWPSIKWQDVSLKDYQTVADAESGLDCYFRSHFYSHEWP
jgi:hypothetical protein